MYNVLIIDIENIFCEIKIWNECGFTTPDYASNLKDISDSKKYDLIFADINIPLFDGIAFLKDVKKRSINTEVVFIITRNDFEYARQGFILGAFDYILKPAAADNLRNILVRAKQKFDKNKYEPCIKSAFELCGMKCDTAFAEQLYGYLMSGGSRIITMEEMAEQFEITKDYFGKLFKRNFGISFNNFYSVLKIEYAKIMLKSYNYKVYEISEILGYSSRDYFTKIFGKITGKTPTEYKNSTL